MQVTCFFLSLLIACSTHAFWQKAPITELRLIPIKTDGVATQAICDHLINTTQNSNASVTITIDPNDESISINQALTISLAFFLNDGKTIFYIFAQPNQKHVSELERLLIQKNIPMLRLHDVPYRPIQPYGSHNAFAIEIQTSKKNMAESIEVLQTYIESLIS